jgi:acetyl-CoA carboxylase biotin carboxyl carrier protein
LDPKEIRELIELISRSDFAEFELEGKGFKLKLVKQGGGSSAVAVEPPLLRAAPVAPAPAAPAAEPEPKGDAPAKAPDDGLVDLKSPIVGTFYRAAGPDAPPFVEVGSRVRKGQVACIVEAMKVMNEIESEIDAEVVEAPVANGQPVEYGETLFRLRPVS